MADYYTDFSFMISHLSETEQKWLKEVLQGPETDSSDLDNYEKIARDLAERHGIDADSDSIDFDFWPGADYKFEKNNLWIHSEGGGDNLDNLSTIIQLFLIRFRPADVISVEWANTCSKPRLDAFGGGIVTISAFDIDFETTGNIAGIKRSDAKKATTQMVKKGYWTSPNLELEDAEGIGLEASGSFEAVHTIVIPMWARIVEDRIIGNRHPLDMENGVCLKAAVLIELQKAMKEPIRKLAYVTERLLQGGFPSQSYKEALLVNLQEIRGELGNEQGTKKRSRKALRQSVGRAKTR